MADRTTEDFLYSSPVDYPAYADPAEPAPKRRIPPAVLTAGWLAVGLVVGVIAMTVLHSSRSTNANGVPAAVAGNQPPAAGGFGGPPAGGPQGSGGGFGSEQHLIGTLTAVGSSTITVRTTNGTTTYHIDSTTQLVKDGQQVSSLSAMHAGDNVVVHVYPLNGTMHVERVIDGVPPGQDGNGGGQDNAGTTTT